MTSKTTTGLRRQAEELAQSSTAAIDDMSVEDIRHLVHELRVHQIELEMQNAELRRAQTELEISHRKYTELYDYAPVGYCTLDERGVIEEINLTAADQLGMKRDSLLDTSIYCYIFEDDRDTFFRHLRKTFERGSRQTHEIRMSTMDGPQFNAQIESIAATGPVDGRRFCRTTITDVSERKRAEEKIKAALEDKDVLLRELHHRTKNNMQVIRSMLALQAARTKSEEVTTVFKETERRILVMSLVHEKLYQLQELSKVDLRDYVRDLARLLLRSHRVSLANISMRLEVEHVLASIDIAIPCGLVLNELISNSLAHAFPGDRKGEIEIRLSRADSGDIAIYFADNGIGVPEEFDFRSQETLGLQIVFSICERQLRGEVSFERGDGVTCRIRFKD